jgi:hypothetical protein
VAKAVHSKYPDGMYNLLKQIVAVFRSTEYNKEVMQWAKSEYKKDWEHAYHMLMQGKQPYSGV